MPAFLVEMPEVTGLTLHEGANKMVVFADDAQSAEEAAEAHFPGTASWVALGVATEIVAATSLTGYELQVTVTGAAGQTAVVDVTATGGAAKLALASAVVGAAAGATYADDEIVTCVGGVFTRAATFRVVAHTGGAVDTVELEDPGEYTTLPTLDEIVTTTGGAGDGNLTLDGVAAATDSYEVYMAEIVGLLNAHADIAAATIEMSESLLGPRILTVAAISDDIGDGAVTIRFGFGDAGDVSGLKGAIVDEGIAGAVLTMALPTSAALVLPSAPTPVKG